MIISHLRAWRYLSTTCLLAFLATTCTVVSAKSDHAMLFAREQNGNINITYDGIKTIITPQEIDPTASPNKPVTTEEPRLAADGKTLAWIVKYDNCCTSYPIARMLVIYREGHITKKFFSTAMIWDWNFIQGGRRVALCVGATHGNPYSYQLFEVESGLKLAMVDYPFPPKVPVWAESLGKCK